MFIQLGYWGLFLATFLSSTIVPFSSEVVLAGLIALDFDPILCILIATAGNSLGGMTSYVLGYIGKWEWLEKYFHTSKEKIERFQHKIKKWGVFAGLLAWLPFVGDLIAIALGFLRLNPWLSCLWMTIGRLIRFAIVGGIMQLF